MNTVSPSTSLGWTAIGLFALFLAGITVTANLAFSGLDWIHRGTGIHPVMAFPGALVVSWLTYLVALKLIRTVNLLEGFTD